MEAFAPGGPGGDLELRSMTLIGLPFYGKRSAREDRPGVPRLCSFCSFFAVLDATALRGVVLHIMIFSTYIP